MPAATTPLIQTPDLDALRLGDEAAFERLVRRTYPRLLAVAREAVDHVGSAHKATEQTFLRLWQRRETFDRPEAVEQFLLEKAHEAGVREKARRESVHRLESHEKSAPHHASHTPEPTVDDAWAHIAGVMHAAPPDEATLRHREESSRHEAAVHLTQATQRKTSRGMLVGVGVLGIVIVTALSMVSRSSESYALNKALAASDVRDLRAQMGQRANVTLGDETAVLIGADSHVRVPGNFGNTLRGVQVEGTASFTVTRPAGTGVEPFEVRANGVRLIAKGTTFDVRADLGPAVYLRVREGTVTATTKKASSDIASGRTVTIDSLGTVTDAPADQGGPAFAWVDGQFATQPGTTLATVLPELRRWYRLTLEVTDSTLLQHPASFTASLESSKDAIAALEKSANVKFGYDKDGEHMLLSPMPPPAAPGKAIRRN
jgi:ferric-dicitrate binding protein FerR (iron transport regulator)